MYRHYLPSTMSPETSCLFYNGHSIPEVYCHKVTIDGHF